MWANANTTSSSKPTKSNPPSTIRCALESAFIRLGPSALLFDIFTLVAVENPSQCGKSLPDVMRLTLLKDPPAGSFLA